MMSANDTAVETCSVTPMPVLQWPVEDCLLKSPAVENRNRLARAFAARELRDILEIYVGMVPETAATRFGHYFDELEDVGLSLAGTGLELGAGIGVFSAFAIDRYPAIETIHAVELVPDVVRLLQPRVISAFARERKNRVQPISGSFDNLQLPDRSCDFCIEYASLHHSNDLVRTLNEVARVLKPGAPLIAIDRSHHNHLSDAQRTFMLNVEYSAEWKHQMGYPEEPLNRRDNGEHELRLDEWEDAFGRAGFRLDHRLELRPLSLRALARKLLLSLPFSLRRQFGWLPSRARPQTGELGWMTRALIAGDARDAVYRPAAAEHTLFIARRT